MAAETLSSLFVKTHNIIRRNRGGRGECISSNVGNRVSGKILSEYSFKFDYYGLSDTKDLFIDLLTPYGFVDFNQPLPNQMASFIITFTMGDRKGYSTNVIERDEYHRQEIEDQIWQGHISRRSEEHRELIRKFVYELIGGEDYVVMTGTYCDSEMGRMGFHIRFRCDPEDQELLSYILYVNLTGWGEICLTRGRFRELNLNFKF
jgi:hypothetical protein